MSKTNTKNALTLKDDVIRFIESIDVVHVQYGQQTDQGSVQTETRLRGNFGQSQDIQRNLFDFFVNANILKPNLGTQITSFESSGSGWYHKKKEVKHNDQQDMFIYLLNRAIQKKLQGVEESHQKRLAIYNYAKDLEIKDKREYGYPERYNGKLTDNELRWSHKVENYYTCDLDMAEVIGYGNREALLVEADRFGSYAYNRDHTSVKLKIELGYKEEKMEYSVIKDQEIRVRDFNVNISKLKLCWNQDGEKRFKDLTGGEVDWKYSKDRSKKSVKQVKYCGSRFSDNNRQVSLNTFVIYMREWLYDREETKKADTLRAAMLLTKTNILKDMYPEAEIVQEKMWKTDLKKLTHKSARCIERVGYSRGYYGEDNFKIIFKSGSYLVYEKNMMQVDVAIDDAYLGAFDVEYVAPKLRTAEDMSGLFLNQKEAKREEVES